MSNRSRPSPLPISIAHLLPPSSNAPEQQLPSPAAVILGPLPPTSALHLALNYIAISDQPRYEYSQDQDNSTTAGGEAGEERNAARTELRRALVVTGDKGRYHDAIEEDDEDWMREHGGEYGVLHRLRRIDMRFCPSPEHLLILLNLLTADRAAQPKDPAMLRKVPRLVILWDMARGLMEEEEGDDENVPPGLDKETRDKGKLRFKRGITIDSYLSLVAAARAAVDHLSSLIPTEPPVQLVILEPHLDYLSSLPILQHKRDGVKEGMSTPNRERRITIAHGLEKLFGRDAMGYVEDHQLDGDISGAATHTLKLARYPNDRFPMLRHRCPRSQWSAAAALERRTENLVLDQGEIGGWRWSWLPQST